MINFRMTLLILTVLSTFSCQNSQPIRTDKLLPAPQEVNMKTGIHVEAERLKIIYVTQGAGENARFTAELLQKAMEKLFRFAPEIIEIQSFKDLSIPSVVLGIPSTNHAYADFCNDMPAPAEDNEEAYVLDVSKNLIRVSGRGDAGLFYGVQTLIQLLEEAHWKKGTIPGLVINDWPELEERWVHFNYFFHLDRYEHIQEYIRQLAKYKINGIVFEFEDQFAYQTHPVIAAPTAFSPQQVEELTRFAHQYHIDIIPLVQGFGHAAYILKHEQFIDLRENPEIFQSFCPLKEDTYDLIFDLFNETIEATPGVEYFHIGGDEVRVMGECPLCQEKKKEIGELGLYLTWLNRVHEFMKKHDRTIVFWDDMPLKKAGVYETVRRTMPQERYDSIWSTGGQRLGNVVDLFPQDNVFMRWSYNPDVHEGNIRALDWYGNNGFKRMVATAVIGNYPLIPDYGNSLQNIRNLTNLGAEKDVLGVLCTAWGDDAGNHFEIYWKGFLATAEFAWSSGNPGSVANYREKYIYRFFGPDTEGLDEAFDSLSRRVDFWNTALLKKGLKNRNHRDYSKYLIELPDLNTSPEEESWSAHFDSLVKQAKEEKELCREATEIIESNIDRVARNAYNLKVFASMGRLMESHCELILAIGELAQHCDSAKAARSDNRNQEVRQHLNEMATIAESAWDSYKSAYLDLEELWEISRYPKGGDGYIMNTQTNYLAGSTADLSYLILAEKELDFPGYAERLRREVKDYP